MKKIVENRSPPQPQKRPSETKARPNDVALANGIKLSVRRGDIAESTTDVVVNAANASSFTHLDSGVSGALRNACAPDIEASVSAPKFRFVLIHTEGDKESNGGASNYTIETAPESLKADQVRYQNTFGGLRDQGVKWIIHALGPNWIDEDASDPERMFAQVAPRIRATVTAALECASRLGARSVTIPALSGGIFTHKAFDDESRQLHRMEQRIARRELVGAIFDWAEKQCGGIKTSIESLVIVTLLPKGRRRRQVQAEAEMLDEAIVGQLGLAENSLPTNNHSFSGEIKAPPPGSDDDDDDDDDGAATSTTHTVLVKIGSYCTMSGSYISEEDEKGSQNSFNVGEGTKKGPSLSTKANKSSCYLEEGGVD